MCLKYSVIVDNSCELMIKTGIDGDVWDINGPHLENYLFKDNSKLLSVKAITQELKLPVVVVEVCKRNFAAEEYIEKSEKGIFHIIKIDAEPGAEYTIYKYVTVYTGKDEVPNIQEASEALALTAAAAGYETAFDKHKATWKERWEASDVILEGSDEDQLALRYSIYQLQIIAPAHSASTVDTSQRAFWPNL